MSGIEFADPDRGLAAALRSGAAVVFDHEDVIVAEPHDEPLLDGGEPERAKVQAGPAEIELEVTPLGNRLRLTGETLGEEELVACRVLGSMRSNGEQTEIACLGVRTDSPEPDWSTLERRRSLAVAFNDGGLLALSAALPAGAEGHGDEEVAAALTTPEGEPVQISEALLSTQYDDAGRHRRATIELWPEGEAVPPIRAGGSIVCGTSLTAGEFRLDTAFFRWSLDGRPGLGRYEVLRRA